MSVIGLMIIPTTPGSVASPSTSIVARLSERFPAEAHQNHHVDHKLFVNTSSLLPAADVKQRHYTQMLTTSHAPGTTYISTLLPSSPIPSTIAIPSSTQDTFSQLVLTKLQPQWAPRLSAIVDGIAMKLPIEDDEEWILRVGDIRVTGTGARSGTGNNASSIRGTLVELQCLGTRAVHSSLEDTEAIRRRERQFREVLKNVLPLPGEHRIEELKLWLRLIPDVNTAQEEAGRITAEVYAEALRGSRS